MIFWLKRMTLGGTAQIKVIPQGVFHGLAGLMLAGER